MFLTGFRFSYDNKKKEQLTILLMMLKITQYFKGVSYFGLLTKLSTLKHRDNLNCDIFNFNLFV